VAFTLEQRAAAQERVIALARADKRISGGGITGSTATGTDDRWSDIDLAFGVRPDADRDAILAEWTALLAGDLGVIHHWDLHHGVTLYRVYLLPGGLELDIALAPAAHFGARSEKFQPIFGESASFASQPPPSMDELVGWGWLHALSTRTAIVRGRPWAALHWIDALRDQALALACRRAGEAIDHARGFDRLPRQDLAKYEAALVRAIDPDELRRALGANVALFLDEVTKMDAELGSRLRDPLAEAVRDAVRIG
jgi:hypothetical protein